MGLGLASRMPLLRSIRRPALSSIVTQLAMCSWQLHDGITCHFSPACLLTHTANTLQLGSSAALHAAGRLKAFAPLSSAIRNWRDRRIADSSSPHCWSVSRGPPPGAAGSSCRSSQPMCHSAAAGMNGSSSSPHSASIRSSASADVSGPELQQVIIKRHQRHKLLCHRVQRIHPLPAPTCPA